MYGFSIKLAHQYYIRICCQYTLMKFLLHPVGQSFAMVKHWFHFLQPSFSTKCPKREGKLVLLKREKVRDPYDPRSLWIPHLCQLSNHRRTPKQTCAFRQSQGAIYAKLKEDIDFSRSHLMEFVIIRVRV